MLAARGGPKAWTGRASGNRTCPDSTPDSLQGDVRLHGLAKQRGRIVITVRANHLPALTPQTKSSCKETNPSEKYQAESSHFRR